MKRIKQFNKQFSKKIIIIPLLLFVFMANAQHNSSCMTGDCMEGYGVKVWQDGERYEGWFKNGMRDGYGDMKYNDGNRYIGDWSENLRYGHGVLIHFDHPSKIKYVGEWKANTIQGYGSLHLKGGDFQTGYWNKNQFKSIEKQDVCLDGDCQNGWGTYIYPDGSLYIGEFKNNKREGQGTLIYRRGTKYKGTHANNARNGFGTYYYPNGNKYEGGWKNNRKSGEAKMFTGGHLDFIGVYKNNILKSKIDKEAIKELANAEQKKDKTAPTIEIISPEVSRGPIVVSKKKKIRVHGKASDESGVKRIRVSGAEAALGTKIGETRDFESYITLSKGQNEFWVEATDTEGNIAKIDFTIVFNGEENETTAMDKVVESNSDAPRMALVIGNSTYKEVPLRNPMNDAIEIASRLRSFGFEVMLKMNVKQGDMKTVIRDFGVKLKEKGGIGVFYYAGHGIQVDGKNYLIPVDANIEKRLDIEVEAVKLQRVLNELKHANNQMNLVILDACRDNPYSGLRSSSKGLAPVYGSPVGTFIAYATSPGQAASDGDSNHGLYTQELLNVLDNCKGMSIEDVFKLVRSSVSKKSENNQVPWENSSLIGNFIINP